MNDKTYLMISGAVFGLITLGQLTRLMFQIPVQIGTWGVPLWASLIFVAIALTLCIWAFRLLRAR